MLFRSGVERKTGLIARYHTMQTCAEAMQNTLVEMQALNEEQIRSNPLDQLCQQMESHLATLRKE